MRRGRLGRTTVQVTELGFGGAPIGNLYAPVSDEQARAAADAAWLAAPVPENLWDLVAP
jgi:D-threo-aldose 1-dehydrogenase